jgi:hypothetical protein
MPEIVRPGMAGPITNEKEAVAGDPIPFCAVMVNGAELSAGPSGVPESVAVPSLLSTKVRPVGRVPVSLIVGIDIPFVLMIHESYVPIVHDGPGPIQVSDVIDGA